MVFEYESNVNPAFVLSWQYRFHSHSCLLLLQFDDLQNQNIAAVREKISENLKVYGYELTSSQVRTRLCNLEKQGYITKNRGRHGTVLTDMGIRFIKNLNFK